MHRVSTGPAVSRRLSNAGHRLGARYHWPHSTGEETEARPAAAEPAALPAKAVCATAPGGMCLEFLALFQLAHFDFTWPHILVRGLLI